MSNELAIKQETTHWIALVNKNTQPAELPLIISERENSLTVQTAFNGGLIANLTTPRKEVIKTIRTVILNTAKQFHWSKDMEMQEATTLAIDVYETLKHETLEDIVLMFRMARKNELRDRLTSRPIKLNGRIDQETIFNQIIPAYLNLKAQERERRYQEQKTKQTAHHEPMYPEAKEQFAKLRKTLKKKMTAHKEAPPRQMSYSPIDEMVRAWINEFDTFRSQDKLPKGVLFCGDFLDHKRKQLPFNDYDLSVLSDEYSQLSASNSLPKGTSFIDFLTFKE